MSAAATTAFDPRDHFPGFYQNPAVQTLAQMARWTISGQLADPEAQTAQTAQTAQPISRCARLPSICATSSRAATPVVDTPARCAGPWAPDERCLATLDELTRWVPSAANAAFHLEAMHDGLMVIDIEPGCPHEVTDQLLQLPGILYSELSMSGRGYHLVTALPDNLDEFRDAMNKRVLIQEHRHFEILLDHWITFTRTPIPEARLAQARAATLGSGGAVAPEYSSVEALYAHLAVNVRNSRPTVSGATIDVTTDLQDIEHGDFITQHVINQVRPRLRSPAEFNDDLSRWEFSVLGTIYGCLSTQIRAFAALGFTYTDADRAVLLHNVAKDVIPERSKHHQVRNGRPFLLDRAAALVAERKADR